MAVHLAHLALRKQQEDDYEAAHRFRSAARRLVELDLEIRDCAQRALHRRSAPANQGSIADAFAQLEVAI